MEKYNTDHLFTFKHINNVIGTLFMCLNNLIKQFYSFDRTFFMKDHFIQPKLLISSQTKKIGLALINDLELCITARLAFYLDVNPCYDGHEATFIWTEYFLQDHPQAEFSEVREAFLQLIPGC
jgi:hypothetical protein